MNSSSIHLKSEIESNYITKKLVIVFLNRIMVSLIFGSIIALVMKIVGFEFLGFIESIIAMTFWIMAVMTSTFYGKRYHMLFWILLIENTLLLYQISIYTSTRDQYIFLKLGPFVLAIFILIIGADLKLRSLPNYILVWLSLNTPSLISILDGRYINAFEGLLFWLISVIFPICVYSCVRQIKREKTIDLLTNKALSILFLLVCVVPLLLIPLEMSFRGTTGFAGLQFGGGFYSNIAIVILIFPLILKTIINMGKSLQFFFYMLIFLIFLFSFSRGAYISLILCSIALVFLGGLNGRKVLMIFLSSSFLISMFAFFIFQEFLLNAVWFMLLRLNLVSNSISAEFTFDFGAILNNSRDYIWNLAFQLFEKKPLFGYGIGSTPNIIKEISFSEFSFSGMHNMFLTVLVERGIFGFLALILILSRIIKLILQVNSENFISKKLFISFFLIFLFFSNATGAELFLNSSRAMNVSISIYLFVMLALLEKNKMRINT